MTSPTADPRIKPHHRRRAAIVYARQSSPDQVRSNTESTRLQLGLRGRAIEFGWHDSILVDDDLGISASGFAERPGFQRMLSLVATRKVGLILCSDASRLSRNSPDWAQLFELCGYFDTLIADVSQVYDLAVPNDRLVLGLRGVISEMELATIRHRMKMGSEAKAARGELKFIVPPGYTHDPDGLIVLDPNRRVREAIAQMFHQFDRATSIRQLALWYRHTETVFPVRKVHKTCPIQWQIPTPSTLRKLLEHPIYAGAYVYGRRQERIEYVDGKLVKREGHPRKPEQARVFIRDHHSAYITWDKYEANQAKIAEAKPRWNMEQNRGAIRDGLALLTGLLRCRHCGRMLRVSYKKESAMYYCDAAGPKGSRACLSFGSKAIDKRVGTELCKAVQPLAIEAALAAHERFCDDQQQARQQARLQLDAAKYEAERAFEQYDLVDPKNRLVADTLEDRLNQKLAEQRSAKQRLEAVGKEHKPLSKVERQRLFELADDFPRLWGNPVLEPRLKKQLLRTAINEIVVAHQPEHQRIEVIVHWHGGTHTQLYVKKRATPIGSKADPSLIETVRTLADTLKDAEIARVLNMKKLRTPRDLPWTQDRVCNFRRHHKIRLGEPRDDPNILTGQQAAEYLGISRNGLLGLIRLAAIDKNQVTDFAPWRISRTQLDSDKVQALVRFLKREGRLPRHPDPPEDQQNLFKGGSEAEKDPMP